MEYFKTFEQFVNESLNESESYNDYPESARKDAQKALDWKEKYGDEVDAGTPVGWKRANQLAKGEKLSIDTIKRMKAFFDRHDGNQSIDPKHKDEPWKDNGHVAWLLWGGDSAKKWAESKLKKISENSTFVNEGKDYPVSPGVRFSSNQVFKEGDTIEAEVDGKMVGLFDLLLKRNYFDGFEDISLYRQGISPNKKYMVISTASIRGRKNIKISAPFSGFMILDEDSVAVVMRKDLEGVWVNTLKQNPEYFTVKDEDWNNIIFDTATGELIKTGSTNDVVTRNIEKTYDALLKDAEDALDPWSWINTGYDTMKRLPEPMKTKLMPMNATPNDIKKNPKEVMYALYCGFSYHYTEIHSTDITRIMDIEFDDPKGPEKFYDHPSSKKVIKKYEKKLISLVAKTQADFIKELKDHYAKENYRG